MGKHIVVIEGSPRVAKNTDRVVGAFLRGAQEAGHTTYKLSLAKNRVNGCIHCMQCGKNGYALTAEAEQAAGELFRALYENRDENFGNGRDVRNCFEDMIVRQSNRVAAMEEPDREALMAVLPEDLRDGEAGES